MYPPLKKYPRLVGVCGKAGCGKDTAANYLHTRFGYYQYQLARPIKDAICAMFNLPYTIWHHDEKDWNLPGCHYSPRMLAQTLGTEWGRNIDENMWVRQLAAAYVQINNDGETQGREPGLVISDVRFDNEANWIQQQGGVVIRIDRPDSKGNVRRHSSEDGVSEQCTDSIIDNDSDVITFLQRFNDKLLQLADYGNVDFEWYE